MSATDELAPLPLATRIWLAFILPWRVLFDGRFAARVEGVGSATPLPPPRPEPAVVVDAEPDETPALQLLAALQREGRFIDFLQEDVSTFTDVEIGAAARVVHEGCKRALADCVTVRAIRDEAEGAGVQLAPGYDATRNKVTGNVVGEPPYSGKLAHHGWEVERVRLPKLAKGHDPHVLAAAEIEL